MGKIAVGSVTLCIVGCVNQKIFLQMTNKDVYSWMLIV